LRDTPFELSKGEPHKMAAMAAMAANTLFDEE